jgi:phosphate transport system substrate-binding protein
VLHLILSDRLLLQIRSPSPSPERIARQRRFIRLPAGEYRLVRLVLGGESPTDDPKKGNIAAGGSTALQPLLTQAAGTFKSEKDFTGVITIDGGSSGQGLADVAAGKTDIGASDVAPEQLGLDGTGLVDHQVAIVAVGVAASKDVSENLADISTADLKGIFTGKITDWKQVTGWKGESLPITAYYYKAGSGIRYIFDTYGINSTLTDEQLLGLRL